MAKYEGRERDRANEGFNMRGGRLTLSRLTLPRRTCSSLYARAPICQFGRNSELGSNVWKALRIKLAKSS
jgi:hypothetical protein